MAVRTWSPIGNSHNYQTATNWTADDTPDASDDVVLQNCSVGIDGSDNSAVALTSFTTYDSFTGYCGNWSPGGELGTYLIIDSATTTIGKRQIAGRKLAGSPLMLLDIGATTANAVTIHSTGVNSSYSMIPPLVLKANKTTHTVEMWEGYMALGGVSDEEATVIGTGFIGRGMSRNCKCIIAPGVTFNTACSVMNAHVLYQGTATCPSLVIYAGGVVKFTGGSSTAITVHSGGRLIYAPNAGTTATAITVKGTGVIDLSQANNIGTRTITTLTMDNEYRNLISNPAVTITNRVSNEKGGGGGPASGGGGIGDAFV